METRLKLSPAQSLLLACGETACALCHRNRNYVESRLAYRIQEKAYGALPTNIRKMRRSTNFCG